MAEASLTGLPGAVSNVPIGGLVLLRLNTDGTFDNSFGQEGVVQFGTNSNPVGSFTVYQPVFPFGEKGIENPVASTLVLSGLYLRDGGLVVQADGKIVVTGYATADQNVYTESQGFVERFNPDGSPDTTFGPNGVQFTTLVASGTTFETVDPLAVGIAPDGSVVVVGSVDYGLRGFLDLGLDGYLAIVDFQDGAPPGGAAVSQPAAALPAAPAASGSNTSADAIFQLMASEATPANGGSAPGNLFVLPNALPSRITPLPVPGESQSEAVARISGGGDAAVNALDDPFALTGEPDRIGNLVLAGEADGPGL